MFNFITDVLRCSVCRKLVPQMNFDLHELRCLKPPSMVRLLANIKSVFPNTCILLCVTVYTYTVCTLCTNIVS